MADGHRYLKFGRWGLAEDPRGAHVVFTRDGREQLATVEDAYYSDKAAEGWFLKLRYFNGEPVKDISAGCVQVLDRDWKPSI